MDPRVEALLMAKVAEDVDAIPSTGEAATMGAIPGAIVGAMAGQVPHSVLKNTTGRLLNRNAPMKPGMRAAGGLVGALFGGALGEGTRQMMIQQVPGGAVLAKAQSGQELNEFDKMALQQMLQDAYIEMGLR